MAVQPFENLPAVLRKRKAEVVRLVNGITQKAASAGGSYLAESTPVKRGIARSNWVASVDVPFVGVISPYHFYLDVGHGPAPADRFYELPNYISATSQHTAAAASFDALRNKSIIIRNNAEHIGALNQGHSRQNPVPGWFQKSANIAKAAIQGVWRLRP